MKVKAFDLTPQLMGIVSRPLKRIKASALGGDNMNKSNKGRMLGLGTILVLMAGLFIFDSAGVSGKAVGDASGGCGQAPSDETSEQSQAKIKASSTSSSLLKYRGVHHSYIASSDTSTDKTLWQDIDGEAIVEMLLDTDQTMYMHVVKQACHNDETDTANAGIVVDCSSLNKQIRWYWDGLESVLTSLESIAAGPGVGELRLLTGRAKKASDMHVNIVMSPSYTFDEYVAAAKYFTKIAAIHPNLKSFTIDDLMIRLCDPEVDLDDNNVHSISSDSTDGCFKPEDIKAIRDAASGGIEFWPYLESPWVGRHIAEDAYILGQDSCKHAQTVEFDAVLEGVPGASKSFYRDLSGRLCRTDTRPASGYTMNASTEDSPADRVVLPITFQSDGTQDLKFSFLHQDSHNSPNYSSSRENCNRDLVMAVYVNDNLVLEDFFYDGHDEIASCTRTNGGDSTNCSDHGTEVEYIEFAEIDIEANALNNGRNTIEVRVEFPNEDPSYYDSLCVTDADGDGVNDSDADSEIVVTDTWQNANQSMNKLLYVWGFKLEPKSSSAHFGRGTPGLNTLRFGDPIGIPGGPSSPTAFIHRSTEDYRIRDDMDGFVFKYMDSPDYYNKEAYEALLERTCDDLKDDDLPCVNLMWGIIPTPVWDYELDWEIVDEKLEVTTQKTDGLLVYRMPLHLYSAYDNQTAVFTKRAPFDSDYQVMGYWPMYQRGMPEFRQTYSYTISTTGRYTVKTHRYSGAEGYFDQVVKVTSSLGSVKYLETKETYSEDTEDEESTSTDNLGSLQVGDVVEVSFVTVIPPSYDQYYVQFKLSPTGSTGDTPSHKDWTYSYSVADYSQIVWDCMSAFLMTGTSACASHSLALPKSQAIPPGGLPPATNASP